MAARHLLQMPVALVAVCVTAYTVCSARGTVLGGFLASDPARCVWMVLVGLQLLLIASAFRVRKVRRTALPPTAPA